MTLLLLIRHGHTDTAGKRLTGQARGVHLNELGLEQAESLIERLEGVPIHALYTSPLERCRETIAPLARERGLFTHARRALSEVDYGEWTGRPLSQLRRTRLWRTVQQAPSGMRFPGGESLLDVQRRAVAETATIASNHPKGTVVVCSHADVIRLLLTHNAGIHPDHLQRLVVDPASVTAIALGDGTPRILKVNDTGDLSAFGRPKRARSKVRG